MGYTWEPLKTCIVKPGFDLETFVTADGGSTAEVLFPLTVVLPDEKPTSEEC